MRKITEQICKAVNDVMSIPGELSSLAKTYTAEGYSVKRGPAGVVLLQLVDGEVHFIPDGLTIKQVIFTY